MTRLTRHLKEVNLTYCQHVQQALAFCLGCAIGSVVLFVHAIFPFVFEKAGSQIITALYKKMSDH